MVVRFCLYSVFKNLRFADPFVVLFFMELKLSLTEVGGLLGGQHLLTAALEVPLGAAADRWGRRRALAAGFAAYASSFGCFAAAADRGRSVLMVAVLAFGAAEALRSGSHKAIILDYLAQRGERDRAAEVIGLARAFSKAASGASALVGGALLYYTASYRTVFLASLVGAVLGFFLMWTYPASLEGEQAREGRKVRFGSVFRAPEARRLVLQSTLFETQAKVLLRYYFQPFLKATLGAVGLGVVGAGALVIGAIEAARDIVGVAGARWARDLQRRAGTPGAALILAYRAALGCGLAVAVAAYLDLLWLGVGTAALLSLLQNARRPVFVAAFDRLVPAEQRATALSAESLARTLAAALCLPALGLVADTWGLWAAFVAMTTVLSVGLWLSPGETANGRPR